jgi:hypothetical protein
MEGASKCQRATASCFAIHSLEHCRRKRQADGGERRRFFEIARGSTLAGAAIQDVLEVCGALSPNENANAKKLLDRMVAMLTRLGPHGYSVREGPDVWGSDDVESDFYSDADSDNDFKSAG